MTTDHSSTVSIRKATLEDVATLEQVIAESTRVLMRGDYTEAQLEAALGTAFGVDTELIRDQTYFVVEAGGAGIVACCGWSRRKTLFGADGQQGRQSEILDSRIDSARIRAFFVRPDWARRGIGRLLLRKCEDEARSFGFKSTQLLATLAGHRLYRVFGYVGEERVEYPLRDGVTIPFVPMRKDLL